MDRHDELLTVSELAEHLNVAVKTLYAWRYRGEGPVGFRIGRHVRYHRRDIQQWIQKRVALSEPGRQ